MDIVTVIEKVKRKKIKGIIRYCKRKLKGEAPKKVYRFLLLTNRDSDNVGDQVIEACDISLIKAVMRNLNISEENYEILSREASVVSQKYLTTEDEKFLKTADNLIKKSDIVIFGGAPMFNYLYQNFYERTSVTLELAEKHGKPVLFSAIGVDGYDEENEKCQRLKKVLNSSCVRQITTRDNYEALQKFKERKDLPIGKVSDPAVFTADVFRPYFEKVLGEKPRVGIFILRAHGFKDNHIDFSREDSARLWLNLIAELERRGYDYELLTSGHFGDEAFLDCLIREYNVNAKKCVFNINSPEQLIKKIATYHAIVSCRLHPSIISYSLGVPAVGIVWNDKVKGFYKSIGHAERAIEANGVTADAIAQQVEAAIAESIEFDAEYKMSVYCTLFNGIKGILFGEEDPRTAYTYEELLENLPVYAGTSNEEQDNKIRRKFRRTYGKYNDLFVANQKMKKEIRELQEKAEAYGRTD